MPVQQDTNVPGYATSRGGYRISGKTHERRFILTDAQIKALGTIPLVESPGPGNMIIFRSALVIARLTAGYTNIDATNSDFNLVIGATPVANIANDAGFNTLFGSAGNKNLPVAALGGLLTSSDIDDDTLDVLLANGTGALTGGNAANRVELTIWYTVSKV